MLRITNAHKLSIARSIDRGTTEQQCVVREILAAVKESGDKAVRAFTQKYDGVTIEKIRVTEEEFLAAKAHVPIEVRSALQEAADNIRAYHQHQACTSWFMTRESGTMLGQMIRPLQSVGLYVPGGSASYPSSVLMNAIPAQVAGVEKIVMVTPPDREGRIAPAVIVAAEIAGVTEIYKVGGAQAIGALTYGTQTIPAVDKIVGPGNIYVALAKREVFGVVSIDMIAGPSEIVVLADETASPSYIAADLLSQAEHDPLASAILLTTSQKVAEEVAFELERQIMNLPRKKIAEASLRSHGAICVVADLEEGFAVVNRLAPEHLELLVEDAHSHLGKIKNAGAVFLGPYSSEPVGDYFAGPNHVLPTNGTARFSSPLSVDDFIKKMSVISYSKADLVEHGEKIMRLAETEGLTAHAKAIQVRLASVSDKS
ncbi:histidinol dehydrogenase [Brevibacillus laterosporus]|uniref:histidinol dehydrogenase n=1 Tax=Brevibacillus laterosporus TaxID=1465 RepID=UPI0003B1C1AB|nr:histidinol dehydrogenase [Brevibacillus laterosporus]ERM17151.1 histidinol dehydrogenase [Brevibacillus laterosporus PE36]